MIRSTKRPRTQEPWRRYLPWQGQIEVLLWVLAFVIPAIANTFVTRMDAQRENHALPLWQPALWEGSSALASLALLPAVLALCSRWPLHSDTWRRRWGLYLGGSVVWSIAHVVGMVLLRKLGYWLVDDHYDFGNWARGFAYEYLKDARTFAMIVFVDHGYRWFWRRLQGEALLLDPAEDAPSSPAPELDRPERFLVRKLGRDFLIATADIEWAQASGNYVNLRVRGHDYPLRSTLAGLEARLDPGRFVRIHRSYLVNLDRVVSIQPLDTGDARVHVADGGTLPCSRRYRASLKDLVGSTAGTAAPAAAGP